MLSCMRGIHCLNPPSTLGLCGLYCSTLRNSPHRSFLLDGCKVIMSTAREKRRLTDSAARSTHLYLNCPGHTRAVRLRPRDCVMPATRMRLKVSFFVARFSASARSVNVATTASTVGLLHPPPSSHNSLIGSGRTGNTCVSYVTK